MFGIAIDLMDDDGGLSRRKGADNPYSRLGVALEPFGFAGVMGGLYVAKHDDLTRLVAAMEALKALPWFPPSVRDIRAFRVEQWSDFTATIKVAEPHTRKPQ